MKNSCGSCKHVRAVDGKQNLQFHWPNGKECVEISYFDFDLKNNIVILWTENLISDTVH
jgi:hypothetical protein